MTLRGGTPARGHMSVSWATRCVAFPPSDCWAPDEGPCGSSNGIGAERRVWTVMLARSSMSLWSMRRTARAEMRITNGVSLSWIRGDAVAESCGAVTITMCGRTIRVSRWDRSRSLLVFVRLISRRRSIWGRRDTALSRAIPVIGRLVRRRTRRLRRTVRMVCRMWF